METGGSEGEERKTRFRQNGMQMPTGEKGGKERREASKSGGINSKRTSAIIIGKGGREEKGEFAPVRKWARLSMLMDKTIMSCAGGGGGGGGGGMRREERERRAGVRPPPPPLLNVSECACMLEKKKECFDGGGGGGRQMSAHAIIIRDGGGRKGGSTYKQRGRKHALLSRPRGGERKTKRREWGIHLVLVVRKEGMVDDDDAKKKHPPT